jgi:hypothetical protein
MERNCCEYNRYKKCRQYGNFRSFISAGGFILIISGISQFAILNYLEFGSIFPSSSKVGTIAAAVSSAQPLPNTSDVPSFSITASDRNRLESGTLYSVEEVKSPLERRLAIATSRLYREISDLGRRGNTNLLIGILTTVIGVCILVYVVYTSVNDELGWNSGIHAILRLRIAVFVQTFAYFFLRLYKTSLDDIKYYQNEITNLESKWLALDAVIEEKDKALLKIVVDALSKTERNFILKKGDSTLGLERERLEKNEVIELVRDALGAASKIKTGR